MVCAVRRSRWSSADDAESAAVRLSAGSCLRRNESAAYAMRASHSKGAFDLWDAAPTGRAMILGAVSGGWPAVPELFLAADSSKVSGRAPRRAFLTPRIGLDGADHSPRRPRAGNWSHLNIHSLERPSSQSQHERRPVIRVVVALGGWPTGTSSLKVMTPLVLHSPSSSLPSPVTLFPTIPSNQVRRQVSRRSRDI